MHVCGQRRALDAILACLIPDDRTPGAVGCGVGERLVGSVPGLEELLDRVLGFESWDAAVQDSTLRRLDEDGDAAFAALVEAAHTAFYADSRSWPALGYATGVTGHP